MSASPVPHPLAPGIVPDKQLSPLVPPTAPSPRRWKHAQVSRSDDNRLPHVPTAGTKHRCQRLLNTFFLLLPLFVIASSFHPNKKKKFLIDCIQKKKIICKNINYTILITLFLLYFPRWDRFRGNWGATFLCVECWDHLAPVHANTRTSWFLKMLAVGLPTRSVIRVGRTVVQWVEHPFALWIVRRTRVIPDLIP